MKKISDGFLKKGMAATTVLSAILAATFGWAGEAKNIVSGEERNGQLAVSPDQRIAQLEASGVVLESKMPMLSSRDQLPDGLRQMLERRQRSEVEPMAWGSGLFPFTTAKALTITKADPTPYLKADLARGVGKLLMRFGTSWYQCTASLIDKAVLVTAAHCVQDYGLGASGKASEVIFQPMRDGSKLPYGAWKGKAWMVPSVYYNGEDTCQDGAEGVVCENDLAVVVIEKRLGYFVGPTVFPATDGAYKSYKHESDFYGYIPLDFSDSLWGTQLTQFGYPAAMEGGLRMIRTDSLGIMEDPYNVVIGSDQTGGSSGGPWFVNYGRPYVSTSSVPYENKMALMAVTSWGYTDSEVKVQGASRFGKNSTYVSESNIDSLHGDACALFPSYCY